MMMIEDFKKDMNYLLKETQESTSKQLEGLKEETQKSLKQLQKNTTKQGKELNKAFQDLKMEIHTIKKSQRETTLEIENLGKRPRVMDTSITNRIQEREERISGTEDIIENIDTTVKENAKCKKLLTQTTQEIQDTMRRPNLRIICIEEREDKDPVNIFNKIIEENFPNLKKEVFMTIQEAYRTPDRLGQKRNFSHHVIVKNTKCTKQKKNIKSSNGKRSSNIYRHTYQNYTKLLTRDHESQKILGRCHTETKRTHMSV
jgi:chromosome segregation ATPase